MSVETNHRSLNQVKKNLKAVKFLDTVQIYWERRTLERLLWNRNQISLSVALCELEESSAFNNASHWRRLRSQSTILLNPNNALSFFSLIFSHYLSPFCCSRLLSPPSQSGKFPASISRVFFTYAFGHCVYVNVYVCVYECVDV